MKNKNFLALLCAILVFLILPSCAADAADDGTKSIYDEIVFDGADSYIAGLEYGMSVDAALDALGLTEKDANVSSYEEMTTIVTNQYRYYAEFGKDCGVLTGLYFKNDELYKVGHSVYVDMTDTAAAYDLAAGFIEDFLEKSGAAPMSIEEYAEPCYMSYGTTESLDKETFLQPNQQLNYQLMGLGVLGEIGLSSHAVPNSLYAPEPFENDMVYVINITSMLEWQDRG